MTELVDLVDTSGRVQVESIPRGDADSYADLYLQIAVAVIFSERGNILVQKRAPEKKVDPGCIDFVCGVVLSGEDPLAAAKRETFEETGVTVDQLRFVARGVNLYGKYKHLFVGQVESEHTGPQFNREVEWARFMPIISFDQSKPQDYVGDFFSDLDMARDYTR